MNGKPRSNARDAPYRTMDGNTAKRRSESVPFKGDHSNYQLDTQSPLDHESRVWPQWLLIAGERAHSKRAKGHKRGPIWRTTTPEGSKGTTGNGMWVVRISDLESKDPEVRR